MLKVNPNISEDVDIDDAKELVNVLCIWSSHVLEALSLDSINDVTEDGHYINNDGKKIAVLLDEDDCDIPSLIVVAAYFYTDYFDADGICAYDKLSAAIDADPHANLLAHAHAMHQNIAECIAMNTRPVSKAMGIRDVAILIRDVYGEATASASAH